MPALGLSLWACDREHPEGNASESEPLGSQVASAPLPAAPSAIVSNSSPAPAWNPSLPEPGLVPETLEEQREAMFRRMSVMLELDEQALGRVRAIFAKSKVLSQGNPKLTKYAMTREECQTRRTAANVVDADEPLCGARFMAPIWDVKAGKTKSDATVCIDRYEFPGIPCEYPVTWVQAYEAAELCKAIGKRLCDAHEWEGGCAGSLLPAEQEYAFGKPRKEMKQRHNDSREITWAHGAEKSFDKCAMASEKNKSCKQSGWKNCGSNSYPAGSFPECKSSFGVYDQHGNVAEHMSLPLKPEQLGSRGGAGETEMKGSWFIFQKFEAHDDDCRWRAPDWHVTKVMSRDSHLNYHLGFRCCKDVPR